MAKPLFVSIGSHAREAFRVDALNIYPGPGSKGSMVYVNPEPWATGCRRAFLLPFELITMISSNFDPITLTRS